jgi:hypothetical protein
MTGAFADMADDCSYNSGFSAESIDMLRADQTKQPRLGALSLGDSDVFDPKKESVTISSQP